jgi:hypothetical protein
MNATQRSDGTFVDVQTDVRTVSFQRPTLEQSQAFQGLVCANQTPKGCLELALACACNVESARELFEEWPGATMTVAGALAEMVTPRVREQKKAGKR